MLDFHFLDPFWLLTAVPAAALWWRIWQRQDRMDSWMQIVAPHLLEHLLVGEQRSRRLCPVHLLFAVWVLSAVALAGPTWRREPSPFADDQAGLVVLMKVSGTMMATDVQPSRLERAKHKLRDLLELRKGASTGLIVYSGSAHLVMPLTRDDRMISAMVEDLTPKLMPTDGDALSQAFKMAGSLFERAGVSGSVLIMADSVSPSQLEKIATEDATLPAQFLLVLPSSAPADAGLERVARSLRAPVIQLTVDQTDVTRLARTAQSRFTFVASAQMGDRWQNDGYALLPLIALSALMWSRKGWAVR